MEYGIKAITSSMNQPKRAPSGFQNIAAAGRYGDDTVAHLDSGEVVIPKNLQSPGLMALFAKNARGKNINPAQYIVGSKHNNVNPTTGLQEFWGGTGSTGDGVGGGQNGAPGASPGGGGGGQASGGRGDSPRSGVLGTQGEFDSEQSSNPMGTANAQAMGWGADNTDPTPASMYDLDAISYQDPISVAANFGYAPSSLQSFGSFLGSILGFPLGLKVSPATFSDDEFDVSFNPVSFVADKVIPGYSLAEAAFSSILGLSPDQALGTSIGVIGSPVTKKSFSDALSQTSSEISQALSDPFGGLGDALASAPESLGNALSGDIGLSLGDPNATAQTDNEGRGPSDIVISGDVSPQILFDASPVSTGIETFTPGGFAPGQLLAGGSGLPNYLDFFDVDEDGNVNLRPEHKDLLDQYIYRNLPSLTV